MVLAKAGWLLAAGWFLILASFESCDFIMRNQSAHMLLYCICRRRKQLAVAIFILRLPSTICQKISVRHSEVRQCEQGKQLRCVLL